MGSMTESEYLVGEVKASNFLALLDEAARESSEKREKYAAHDSVIVKLVNGIIVKAIQQKVNEIHVLPRKEQIEVWYRKDGVIKKVIVIPPVACKAVRNRLKIVGGLDITMDRVPQDGRINFWTEAGRTGEKYILYISSRHQIYGEAIVLYIKHLGYRSMNDFDLKKLGFENAIIQKIEAFLKRPQGLLLVNGPRDSGKTTTLYSMLKSFAPESSKVMTVEEPIKAFVEGFNQTNVCEATGMTFARSILSCFAHRPDAVMVGNVRDLETLKMAIRAVFEGHLLVCGMYSQDGIAALKRLIRLGGSPSELVASLDMIVSQCLVRSLCPDCRIPVKHTEEELLAAGMQADEVKQDSMFFGPQGCPCCGGIGYRGRTALFELLEIKDELAKAIRMEKGSGQLRAIAVREGMVPFRRAGLDKVVDGTTSLEEVLGKTEYWLEES